MDLSGVIASLRDERTRIDAAIAALEAIESVSVTAPEKTRGGGRGAPSPKRRGVPKARTEAQDDDAGGKYGPAVVSALRDAPVPMRLTEVCRAVSPRNPSSVSSAVHYTLKKLMDGGKVHREGGAYTLKAA